jgi:hypothetical protein
VTNQSSISKQLAWYDADENFTSGTISLPRYLGGQ